MAIILQAVLMTQVLKHIPVFTVAILVFLFVLNFSIRKSNKAQAESTDAFWQREQLANSTRKKDISNLDYITIPEEILPQAPATAAEKSLCELAEQKILNLTGKSNTDLKLEYGVANLEILSACDDRFTELVLVLTSYGAELTEAGNTDLAQKVYEFGVSVGADARPIYTELAKIYRASSQEEKVAGLIQSAEALNSLAKHGILAALREEPKTEEEAKAEGESPQA